MSSLSITTIQTDIAWEDKAVNLHTLEQKISGLAERTEIIVLPEMFNTGFSMRAEALAETMEGDTVQWMRSVAANHKVVLTGSLIIKENESYFNRLIWMLPNGQYGHYDKRHLFALAGEHTCFTPGNKRLIASVKGWKINLLVCYDLRFPVWSRNRIMSTPIAPSEKLMTRASVETAADSPLEYDLLVYVANWPEKRSHAWKTLLCARAIENQCFVIGVNRVGRDGNNILYSGNSLVINPAGEVLYHMADEEDVFTITLEKEQLQEQRRKYPFWQDSDSFTWR